MEKISGDIEERLRRAEIIAKNAASRAKIAEKKVEALERLLAQTNQAVQSILEALGSTVQAPKPTKKKSHHKKRREEENGEPITYSIETLGPDCEINNLPNLRILIATIMTELREEGPRDKREKQGSIIITKENMENFIDKLNQIKVPPNSSIEKAMRNYVDMINLALKNTQGSSIPSQLVQRLTYPKF